jgi:DNA repair protein RadC
MKTLRISVPDINEAEPQDLPRERLIRLGPSYLSDSELLSILIGWGTKGMSVDRVAEEVLKALDRVNGKTAVEDLTRIKGMGSAKAAVITAAIEFSRRRLCPGRRRITTPADILPLVNHYADRRQEHFLTVSLNGAHEVNAVRVVTMGLVNRTVVHPREVFADPLTDRATAVIVAHNHPSGNNQPSIEDREITRRLIEAGTILGIQLLDHIIFSETGYYSFLEAGEL